MSNPISKTGERIVPQKNRTQEDHFLYLRHLFAYEFAQQEIPQASVVLDFGCGEGYGTGWLSQHFKSMVGIDVEPDVIAHAAQHYGSENCAFVMYNGQTLSFQDNSFDAVLSFQVIEHVLDDQQYIKEAYRVLKAGGKFIITTPNKSNRLGPSEKPWNRYHLREYYPHELEALLRTRFKKVSLHGIYGTDHIQAFEMERIRWARKMAKRDPLGLRYRLPASVLQYLITILKYLTGRHKKESQEQLFEERDKQEGYYLSQDNIENSLDLLALSIKS